MFHSWGFRHGFPSWGNLGLDDPLQVWLPWVVRIPIWTQKWLVLFLRTWNHPFFGGDSLTWLPYDWVNDVSTGPPNPAKWWRTSGDWLPALNLSDACWNDDLLLVALNAQHKSLRRYLVVHCIEMDMFQLIFSCFQAEKQIKHTISNAQVVFLPVHFKSGFG